MQLTLDKFVQVPIGKIIQSPKMGFAQIITDGYWLTHNNNVLFFAKGNSPQYNLDRTIVEMMSNSLDFDTEIELIHKAFIPIEIIGDFDFRRIIK